MFNHNYLYERRRYDIGENMNSFTAVVYPEDDMYIAECPEVGTVSQGKTKEEAVANLREATELYLDEFPVPPIR